ncbi:porin family protein [Photobacterium makurazakiensis]|uniref:opacity family porin n=1 Tax=Photobacterium makurazakiensis TaxID=2910234 RepID=UPI003D0BFFB0
MIKRMTAAGVLLSFLPLTAMCNESAEANPMDVDTIAPTSKYFIGLRSGASLMGNSDSITLSGNTVDAGDSDFEAFVAVDVGLYTKNSKNRVYYSYEHHESTSKFNQQDQLETDLSLHLLNADYIYRHDKKIKPFAGLHIGYASAESKSNSGQSNDVSGYAFGVQAGVAWQVTEGLDFEMGVKHTALPSDRRSWTFSDGQGNSAKVESQLKTLTSAYLGANYRF